MPTHSSRKTNWLLAMCLATAVQNTVHAIDAGPISIHGAVSETIAYSDRYNYLGNTAKEISSVNDELTLNGTVRFDNGVRLTTQLYAYKLDGYKDLTLDVASFDYAISEKIGFRAGRIKEAWGLYGESQDVDQVRPFALLPLNQYAKPLRPLNATLDGLSIYGSLSLRRAGSLEYQAYFGRATPADAQQPAVQNIIGASTPINITNFEAPHKVFGGRLTWETPLDGLRVGLSYTDVHDIKLRGTVKTAAQLALAPSDLRYAASILGPIFGGQPGQITIDNAQSSLFAEYTRGNWQFAAETFHMRKTITVALPFSHGYSIQEGDNYYASATYQATSKLQFGAGYELAYNDADDHAGNNYTAVPHHLAWSKDFFTTAAYNLAPWWVVKCEIHTINGTFLLAPGTNVDASQWKADWHYFILKTTISF